MPERLSVTPLEAAIIFLNETFGKPRRKSSKKGYLKIPQRGHYSPEVAKALHDREWRAWFNPEGKPIRPESFLEDAQRSQLLINATDQAIERITHRFRRYPARDTQLIRLRFGMADGFIHTLKETGEPFGVTRERIRYTIHFLTSSLRHLSRSRELRQFLP